MLDAGVRESAGAEVLIPEARRRARRRRAWYVVLILILAGAGTAYGLHASAGGPNHGPSVAHEAREAAAPTGRPTRSLREPSVLAAGTRGVVYISDDTRNMIFAREPNGRIRPFAGTGRPGFSGDGGPAEAAALNDPTGMVFDHRTGTLYFADTGNNRIRAVSRSGTIRTVAGSGRAGWVASSLQARAAHLNGPTALALSRDGELYIACELEIVRLDTSGVVARIAGIRSSAGVRGMGGPALDASTDSPNGLAFDSHSNLYITGSATKGLFVLTPGGRIRDLCPYCLYPRGVGGIVTAPDGSVIVMDTQRIERYRTPTSRQLIVNFAGAAPVGGVRGIEPTGITVAADGTIYIDTNRNDGFTNATTLMAIKPGQKVPTILWRQ